jgi:hypothetical protein
MNVSVALSGNGNTALLGESGLDNYVGAAFVFVRSGSVWSQQGAPVVGNCTSSCTGPDGTGEAGAGLFGSGVALSADGNKALIGAAGDGGPFPNAIGPGAAWIFTRSGSTWSQQGPKLVGSSATGSGSGQGAGVALSGDGTTALINGPNDGNGAGAAWVFTHTGSSWSQQVKLAGQNELYGNQGAEVALSDDGSSALIGGTSGAQAYARSGSTWTREPSLMGTGAVGSAEQGSSVALAGNGASALIGGPFDNGGVGAAWAFVSGASLTVALAGSGSGTVSSSGISCPGTCSESVPAGSTITLSATPAIGSTFTGWSGGECSGTASCTLRLDSDTTVTATFIAPPRCRLNIPSGTVRLPKRRQKHGVRAHRSIGVLAAVIKCDQDTRVKLAGILTELRGHERAHGKSRSTRFTLGPIRGDLQAGVSRTLVLRLPRRALRGLSDKARESALLTLVASNANGSSHARAKVTRLNGKT